MKKRISLIVVVLFLVSILTVSLVGCEKTPSPSAELEKIKDGIEIVLDRNAGKPGANSQEVNITEYIKENGLTGITYFVESSTNLVTVSEVEDRKFTVTASTTSSALGTAEVMLIVAQNGTEKLSLTFDVKVVNTTPAAGAAVTAPTLASKTSSSITINAVTTPSNGQMVEYAINTENSIASLTWQDGLVFSGLNGATAYYIFARAKANTSNFAGIPSAALAVMTDVPPIAGLVINYEKVLGIVSSKPVVDSGITLQLRNNGTLQTTTWSSSADGVAAVGSSTGVLEFKTPGTAIITGTSSAGSKTMTVIVESYEKFSNVHEDNSVFVVRTKEDFELMSEDASGSGGNDIAISNKGKGRWVDKIQGNDIDLSGEVYTNALIAPQPYTALSGSNYGFVGLYDGRGFAIKNLMINCQPASGGGGDFAVGLFGATYGDADTFRTTVRNVNIVGANISSNAMGSVGVLVGELFFTTLEHCFVDQTSVVIANGDASLANNRASAVVGTFRSGSSTTRPNIIKNVISNAVVKYEGTATNISDRIYGVVSRYRGETTGTFNISNVYVNKTVNPDMVNYIRTSSAGGFYMDEGSRFYTTAELKDTANYGSSWNVNWSIVSGEYPVIRNVPQMLNGSAVTFVSETTKTWNSITVNTPAALVTATGQTVEYGISKTNDAATVSAWQTGRVFSELDAETTYYIFARSGQNSTYNAGAVSSITAATVARNAEIIITEGQKIKSFDKYNPTNIVVAGSGFTGISIKITADHAGDGEWSNLPTPIDVTADLTITATSITFGSAYLDSLIVGKSYRFTLTSADGSWTEEFELSILDTTPDLFKITILVPHGSRLIRSVDDGSGNLIVTEIFKNSTDSNKNFDLNFTLDNLIDITEYSIELNGFSFDGWYNNISAEDPFNPTNIYLGIDPSNPANATILAKHNIAVEIMTLNFTQVLGIISDVTVLDAGVQMKILGDGIILENGVIWKSNDTTIVTVDAAGKLSFIAAGATTVTGTLGGYSRTVSVKVERYNSADFLNGTHANNRIVVVRSREDLEFINTDGKAAAIGQDFSDFLATVPNWEKSVGAHQKAGLAWGSGSERIAIIQGNDIDLENVEYSRSVIVPISESDGGSSTRGARSMFDGKGFAIRNINIKGIDAGSGNFGVGLIGGLHGDGSYIVAVRNINLIGGIIESPAAGGVGSLIGQHFASRLENCFVDGVTVRATGTNTAGGIVGFVRRGSTERPSGNIITNVISNAKVESADTGKAFGIAGRLNISSYTVNYINVFVNGTINPGIALIPTNVNNNLENAAFKTEAELKTVSTYETGFSTDIWDIEDSIAEGYYPIIRSLFERTRSVGAAAAMPTVASKTDTTITLDAEILSNWQGLEFAISTKNDAGELTWQADLTFSGLTADTTYFIFARSKISFFYSAGTPSESLSVATEA